VDATIRIFAPDFDLLGIKPKPLPPRHAALKGEVDRAIMDALRGMGEALTTKEIALRIMEARSLSAAGPRLAWTMQKRVGAALRHMRPSGRVRSERGKAGVCLWRLPS
jgi:hypothetical protein